MANKLANLTVMTEKKGLVFKKILFYSGIIGQAVVLDLNKKLLKELEKCENDAKIRKRVHFIGIEVIQNILKYSNILAKGMGMVSIDKCGKFYEIKSNNLVESTRVDELKFMINSLNKLSESELESLYDERLLFGNFGTQGGAGLGFIEMRRKSENEITYSFDKENEECFNFHLCVTINKK